MPERPSVRARTRSARTGSLLDSTPSTESSASACGWPEGAHGARDPWTDPADHLLAGLEATLHDGRTLSIRPTPRRAVGPDLVALVIGMNERYGRIERAWLRVHRLDAPRPMAHPLVADRNPPLSDEEEAMLESIARALRP